MPKMSMWDYNLREAEKQVRIAKIAYKTGQFQLVRPALEQAEQHINALLLS
jgi:hypothetical protein